MTDEPTWSRELRHDCCTHDGAHRWENWSGFRQEIPPFQVSAKPPEEPITTQIDVKAYRYRRCKICNAVQRQEFRSGITEQTI